MYLGILPTIGSIKLWWTPKNKLSKGSQRFHIDQVDRKQLKLLVNIKDTFDIHGPFTFFPKSTFLPNFIPFVFDLSGLHLISSSPCIFFSSSFSV